MLDNDLHDIRGFFKLLWPLGGGPLPGTEKERLGAKGPSVFSLLHGKISSVKVHPSRPNGAALLIYSNLNDINVTPKKIIVNVLASMKLIFFK